MDDSLWPGSPTPATSGTTKDAFEPPSQRWQNVCDYRVYTDRVFSGRSPSGFSENLTGEMKRTERIALSLRTREGVAASELKRFKQTTSEFRALGLLRKSNDNFVLTR